jgi:hypothetical protein
VGGGAWGIRVQEGKGGREVGSACLSVGWYI